MNVCGAMVKRAPGCCWSVLMVMLSTVWPLALQASDWPAYRHDSARSGVSDESLATPLVPRWAFQPRHAPRPAWGEPNPRPVGGWHGLTERRRVHFDDAFHAVVANGAVYFGSSADGKVVCLDAATGRQRWDALTGGPVRLAPTVWQDSVYVGSDDGFVYCLQAEDGGERWKFRAAPSDRRVLGSGAMISLWPVRTGVLVDKGIAYFGAGIFPAEGVYLFAVDAADGRLMWCNDSCATSPQSRISPQGYLLASKDRLFVPLGRVSPAAFDRTDGRLLYESYFEHIIGGTYATLADDQLFTGTEQMIAYDQASHRSQSGWFWGHQLIVTPEDYYVVTGTELFAVKRGTYSAASLRRKKLLDNKRDLTAQLERAKRGPESELKSVQAQMDALDEQLRAAELEMAQGEKWRVPCDADQTLVLAGNVLLVGGDRTVLAFDVATGERLWTGEVDGTARGLAVANGSLFVSCDTGTIYCFGSQATPAADAAGSAPLVVRQSDQQQTAPQPDQLAPVFEAAAEQIVRATGIRRGYCLVLGCRTGGLLLALANRTELQICCLESDPRHVAAARQTLDASGLYGSRVIVEQGDLDQAPFSDYFANLVVSESALVSGQLPGGAREAFRMLKPLGGTLFIGQPAAANGVAKPLDKARMHQWLAEAGIDGGTVRDDDGLWLTFTRGSLPGAGGWTHQYAEPGNTACSDDQRIRCPLGVLWFGDPGPGQMAERHERAAAPLAVNGRMFVLGEGTANRVGAGENTVMAYDAYNGLQLWERKIGGALRVSVTHDSGNSAADADSLFVLVGSQCLRLDAATGDTIRTYPMPRAPDNQPWRWGYIAVVDNVLYGTRTLRGRIAESVFALDVADGITLWEHTTAGVAQGTISIANGQLLFAASQVTSQQREEALAGQVKELHLLSEEERAKALKQLEAASVYRVVALDARAGNTLWEKPVEVTGATAGAYWCSLGAICHRDVLLLFGVFLDGHYWTEFLEGKFGTRRVVAMSCQDGSLLWSKPIGYRVRPVVVGDTLHAEPWAYDLRTGEQRTRIHPVTGREEIWQFARPGHHCGCPAASPHMLLFRSLNLGWYDLGNDFGTQHFGAQRPGCWINFIPANGLLLVPEASSGCMCPFANSCTVVFHGREENRQWAYFSQPGPMTPVKRLALNFGAPGDRKDDAGHLWLGYPRPRGSLVLQLETKLTSYSALSYFDHDPGRLEITGTDKPWLFRSGVRGLRKCSIPVAGPADGRARYTVRLAFAELEHETAGKRVFDVSIQGRLVAENLDVFQEAGGKNRAMVREFPGIEASDKLAVELVSKLPNPTPEQLPVLQGIEIERETVLTLGTAIPDFLLNNAEPELVVE
ncbi:MAG: methyltransferase domain-containing protein [Planctomycetes bacterium]|nr:methyltransferase domain-containing protein [Planctomycetota bacterium]